MSAHEEFQAARQRIEDLLRELTPTIGPVSDVDGGHIDESVPHDHIDALLSEWLIVAAWVDPQSGEPFIVRLCSQNLSAHHRDGLLFQGLYRMEDE